MLLSCIYLKKRFIKKYLHRFAQGKPYVPYETMLKKMVGSTSNFHNIYRFVDNNINHYWSIVMNVMEMDYDYSSEGSCNIFLSEGSCNIFLNEEPNVDASRFFKLLKDFDRMVYNSK
jgi:hypothetical protein